MKVKDLLTDESKWTKGAYARTAEGRMVFYRDIAATRFCLLGAIFRCYGAIGAGEITERVEKKLSDCSTHGWNDDPRTTFADVRRLVEKLDI